MVDSMPKKGRGLSKGRIFDATAVREEHRRLLLRLLWESGEMSRADVSRQTGLSRSTVSAIVNELLDRGLVSEVGAGTSSGGRRPILLAFNYDAFTLAGVDVGATHVGVVLTNLRCEEKAWRHVYHPVREDPAGTIALVKALLWDVLEDPNVTGPPLVGIGIGVPSPVVNSEPNRISSMILPRWVGFDLTGAVQKEFRVPVHLDNDANLGALAEHWWGAGRGERHLVYLKLATGIGAGLIINGEVFHGKAGIAGEIAHTAVEPAGPRCLCGQDGCLGLVTGTGMLLRRVRERIQAGQPSCLDPRTLSTQTLVDAAIAGDRLALETVQRAGHLLGIGIANLLNVLDPGMVVLGGELTQAGPILLDPLIETARRRALSTSIAPTPIVTTQLADRDIALGAATQVLSHALIDESMLIDARAVARIGAVIV